MTVEYPIKESFLAFPCYQEFRLFLFLCSYKVTCTYGSILYFELYTWVEYCGSYRLLAQVIPGLLQFQQNNICAQHIQSFLCYSNSLISHVPENQGTRATLQWNIYLDLGYSIHMWMPPDSGGMFFVVLTVRRVSYSKADHIFWAITGTHLIYCPGLTNVLHLYYSI